MEFYVISSLFLFSCIFLITLFIYKLYFLKHSLSYTSTMLIKMSLITSISPMLLSASVQGVSHALYLLQPSSESDYYIIWAILINAFWWFSLFIVPLWIYVISKKILLKYTKIVDISTYDATDNKSIIERNQITKHAILIVLWVLWVLIFVYALFIMWFIRAAVS